VTETENRSVQMELKMDRDDLWIVEHFSELVTKYAGKYVALVNETLVWCVTNLLTLIVISERSEESRLFKCTRPFTSFRGDT
jgi:hypothetical protein